MKQKLMSLFLAAPLCAQQIYSSSPPCYSLQRAPGLVYCSANATCTNGRAMQVWAQSWSYCQGDRLEASASEDGPDAISADASIAGIDGQFKSRAINIQYCQGFWYTHETGPSFC
jgi:uncharacterized protein YfaQ (DUF2300 family)